MKYLANSIIGFKYKLILLLLLLLFPISCEDPPRSEAEWKEAMDELGAWFASDVMYNHFKDTGEFQIDFFDSEGPWFVTVISARKDSFGLVNAFVGKYYKSLLYYQHIDTEKFLAGDFIVLYDSMLATNSCWRIVDTVSDWNKKKLKDLWLKSITAIGSDGTTRETYRGLFTN